MSRYSVCVRVKGSLWIDVDAESRGDAVRLARGFAADLTYGEGPGCLDLTGPALVIDEAGNIHTEDAA